jgi:fatty-acyl-CoA synthase
MEITGTFKYRKIDLVQQGFDPAVIDQPLFFKQPGAGYVPLTPDVFAQIGAGVFKL